VGERYGVARADPQPTMTAEIVDRPRDDPETYAVQLAEQRRDLARQRSVHEGLKEDRLGPVLALVHRDELGKHRIRGLTARAPSLDPSDQTLGPSAQRRVDETLLCRRVQIDGARRDMGASGDFADAELCVSAPRDLAEGGGLDSAGRPRRGSRALALDVSTIHYRTTVAE
jgi:hypothetical protein